MKGFWVALILLLALTVTIFPTARRVDGALGELGEALLLGELSRAEAIWQEHSLLFRLTLHQAEVIQIDERLAALFSAAAPFALRVGDDQSDT